MFNWTDFLELARTLQSCSANTKMEEAYLRTAISRAYYAAFNVSRE